MIAPWKPATCACGAPHPSYSMTGSNGPWRCQPCHTLAVKAAIENPAPPQRIEPVEPVLKREGLLL